MRLELHVSSDSTHCVFKRTKLHINRSNVFEASSELEAVQDADVLAVMTPWPEFKTVPLESVRKVMRGRLVLDPYGVLDERQCRSLGFVYRTLGTPATSELHVASP